MSVILKVANERAMRPTQELLEREVVEEIPIPVVSDEEWQQRRARGIKVLADLTTHMHFERILQKKDYMSVMGICPDQKVTLAVDLAVSARR